jgi:peptidyl-prolyl cis-trans isomerase B (cyclophilin B)
MRMKKVKAFRLTAAILLAMTLVMGCSSKLESGQNSGSGQTATASPTAASPEATPTPIIPGYQFEAPKVGDTIAIIKTSMGDIKIKLFPNEAPKAVENFVTHARNGYYDNLIFHRVISDFMIQGGDPKGDGTGGESIWGKPFEDEFSGNLLNYRGALSMANSGANTNGSQFFIVQKKTMSTEDISYLEKYKYPNELIDLYKEHGGTEWLDFQHTVFGQVYEGMDVVDKIAAVEVSKKDKPVEDVIIQTIEIQEFGK